jgi:hypothetical protein
VQNDSDPELPTPNCSNCQCWFFASIHRIGGKMPQNPFLEMISVRW